MQLTNPGQTMSFYTSTTKVRIRTLSSIVNIVDIANLRWVMLTDIDIVDRRLWMLTDIDRHLPMLTDFDQCWQMLSDVDWC